MSEPNIHHEYFDFTRPRTFSVTLSFTADPPAPPLASHRVTLLPCPLLPYGWYLAKIDDVEDGMIRIGKKEANGDLTLRGFSSWAALTAEMGIKEKVLEPENGNGED